MQRPMVNLEESLETLKEPAEQAGVHSRVSGYTAPAVVLRLEELPATARNIERVRERVRRLNDQLAASGTPFRLRII